MARWLPFQSREKTRIRTIAARDLRPGIVGVASSEIEPQTLYVVQVSELRKVGIWRDAEGTLALDLQCPHMGADLSEGWIGEDDLLHCPWHGYVFGIREGCFVSNPNVEPMKVARTRSTSFDPDQTPRFRLRTLPLERVGDDLQIQVTA